MKMIRRIAVCVLLFMISFPPLSWALDPIRSERIRGTVQIIKNNGETSWLKHGESRAFEVGDHIITGKTNNIELNLHNENYIRVSPESKIEITKHAQDAVKIYIHYGDILVRMKATKKNPPFSFETRDGTIHITGEKGTHALIWSHEDGSLAGVAYGTLMVEASEGSVDIPSRHSLRFSKAAALTAPSPNNDNIRSRINQVSLIGDSKSATSILEGSHQRSRSR